MRSTTRGRRRGGRGGGERFRFSFAAFVSPVVFGGSVAHCALGYVFGHICRDFLVRLFGGLVGAVAEFEDADSDGAFSKFLTFGRVGHVDVEFAANDFLAGIGNNVLARVLACAPNFYAATDRENSGVSRDHVAMRVFAGSGDACDGIGGSKILAINPGRSRFCFGVERTGKNKETKENEK